MPDITVVIPLYNGARYVHRSLESVLNQSYNRFEVIVVDDGSDDGGGEAVLSCGDPRVRLVRQENRGVSFARNRGAMEGRGSHIAYLDADDEWDRGFLEAVVCLVHTYPEAGIYGTGYRKVFSRGPIVEVTTKEVYHGQSTMLIHDYLERAMHLSPIHSSGVLIPRRILEELGGFTVGAVLGQDTEMWARISLRYPIAYDTRILFSFHETDNGNKPRFRGPARYGPVAKTLQEALEEPCEYAASREAMTAFARKYVLEKCLLFLSRGDWDAVQRCLKDHAGPCHRLALHGLADVFWMRPLLSCWARLEWFRRRFVNSRFFIRILGGRRVKKKISEALKRS